MWHAEPPGAAAGLAWQHEQSPKEACMARVLIRCRFTGHYLFANQDAAAPGEVTGGRIFCPYCATEHAWDCSDARLDAGQRRDPATRQAS